MNANGAKPAAKKPVEEDSDTESESSEEDLEEESDEESDEEDESSEEEETAKPATKKINGTQPAAASSDDDEDEDEDDDDEDEDEDDEDEDEDSSEEEETVKPTKSKVNGTKPALADESSSEEDSSSEEESSEEDDDESSDAESSEEEDEEEEEESKPAITSQKRKEAPSSAPETPAKRTKSDAPTTGSTSIFVGNLSWNIDQEWLASIFESVGGVVSARIITDRETSRPKGFGYVDFETPELAQKALELKDTEVDGRPINVDIATQRTPESAPRGGGAGGAERAQRYGDKISEPSSTLFVGNLNFNTTQDGLWELFGSTGAEVQSVRVPTDKESGQPKG